jgi:hypothetical protein
MDKTIQMAREVKATAYTNRHYPDRTTYTFGPEQLKAFEALVRADERNRTWTQEHWTEYEHSIRNATLDEIADKIGKMPFGDTAASFAVWIREQKT